VLLKQAASSAGFGLSGQERAQSSGIEAFSSQSREVRRPIVKGNHNVYVGVLQGNDDREV
jgi:hypothetical protein